MARGFVVSAALLVLLGSAASASANPAAPDIVVDTPVFMFSGEPGGSFECRVDSGSWAACVSPFDSGVSAVGDHLFEVRQIDDSNHVGAIGWFSWNVAPADDSPPSDDTDGAADASQPLDSAQPLDSSQPLSTTQPLSTDDPAATSQPLEQNTTERPVYKLHAGARIGRLAARAGFVPFVCTLGGVPIGRCSVDLERRSGGAVSVLSAAGHGATMGGPSARSATVLVRLTPAARRALRRGHGLHVIAHVHVVPFGGGRTLTLTRRAVLR